jgi:hypothetical protein
MPSRDKPRRPFPPFPLTAHCNVQWSRKIRGRVCFFGVWANPGAALDRQLQSCCGSPRSIVTR